MYKSIEIFANNGEFLSFSCFLFIIFSGSLKALPAGRIGKVVVAVFYDYLRRFKLTRACGMRTKSVICNDLRAPLREPLCRTCKTEPDWY